MGGFLRGVLKLLVGLVALVAIALGAVYSLSGQRLAGTYAVEVAPLTIPTDAAAIERGRHIYQTRGCADCHGEDLSGNVVADDPLIGRLSGPNLTRGEGGVGASLTDADYIRAIVYGIGADGKGLRIMPAEDYVKMGTADLGALIAYLKQAPPVDKVPPPTVFRPLGHALVLKGDLMPSASRLDLTAGYAEAPPEGPTAEYGDYLANTCRGCHGPTLSGGKIPGAPPDWPPALNLTPDPATGLGQWTEGDFFRAIREQTRPDGTKLDPVMPAQQFARMTDDELKALWAYLLTIEAKPVGNR